MPASGSKIGLSVHALRNVRSASAHPPQPKTKSLIPSGSGQPLAHHVRAHLESRLQHDLSKVRVHAGEAARASANALGAEAYTVGRDIVFRSGLPGADPEGRRLLAHEVAHVVQGERAGGSASERLLSHPGDASEREADAAAQQMADNRWATAFSPTPPSAWRVPSQTHALLPLSAAPAAAVQRVPIKGNAFGDWDFTQKNNDAPAKGGMYSSDVVVRFDPNAKTVDSTEIAFVQNVRTIDKGGKSTDERKNFADRRTADQWTIDRVDQRKHGWYGYENTGSAGTLVVPGSSPTPLKSATLTDSPGFNTPLESWQFETAAIARSGKQVGTTYGMVTWGFEVDKDNKLTSRPVAFAGSLDKAFTAAIDAWNKQATGPAANKNHPDQQNLGPFK